MAKVMELWLPFRYRGSSFMYSQKSCIHPIFHLKVKPRLSEFDGQCIFEHPDPRLGSHPDWGTKIFNYEKPEVKNFLIANVLFWLREFHVDG